MQDWNTYPTALSKVFTLGTDQIPVSLCRYSFGEDRSLICAILHRLDNVFFAYGICTARLWRKHVFGPWDLYNTAFASVSYGWYLYDDSSYVQNHDGRCRILVI